MVHPFLLVGNIFAVNNQETGGKKQSVDKKAIYEAKSILQETYTKIKDDEPGNACNKNYPYWLNR
ncbi:MAG: hypothetical protein NVSMB7_17820 [Chitinophagaceae bacterium]